MKPIRKGEYTLYKGKEYKVYENEDGAYDLVSNDPIDVKSGFSEEYPSLYVKSVKKCDITDIYQIRPFAKYKGERFDISVNLTDGKVNIGTTNAELAKKFNFERTDKYFYEKWVPQEEVEIYEEIKKIKL